MFSVAAVERGQIRLLWRVDQKKHVAFGVVGDTASLYSTKGRAARATFLALES